MIKFHCHALSIKMPNEIGYATIKIIDFSHLGYSGILVKVAGQLSHESTTDTSKIDDGDLLFGARSVSFYPRKVDDKIVIKIQPSTPTKKDFIIPDFKWTNARNPWLQDERALVNWFPLHILSNYGAKTPYERLAHLERTTVYDLHSLVFRIVFEFCRIGKLSLEHFYNIDANPDMKRVMLEAINTPVYSAIPANIRGICVGAGSLDRDIRNFGQSKT